MAIGPSILKHPHDNLQFLQRWGDVSLLLQGITQKIHHKVVLTLTDNVLILPKAEKVSMQVNV